MKKYIPILQEHVQGARLEFEQLVDQAGTLIVTLTNVKGYEIKLKFDSYMSYRKLDEGDALLTLSAIRNSGGTTQCFYRVDESDFLTWFNAERCGQVSGQLLVHYSIAVANDIIDVLALDPPTVEMKWPRV